MMEANAHDAEFPNPVEVIVKKPMSWLRSKIMGDGKEIIKEAKEKDIFDKAVDKLTSYSRASWYDRYYGGYGEKLQTSNQTKRERFPKIYDRVKELKGDARRILSFGCSEGEECFSLRRRFPDAEIVGHDIDHYPLTSARYRNKYANMYFVDELGPCGKFDAITCLMVLFALETKIPKNKWQIAIEKMDRHLNVGGVLFIHVSEYDPWELLSGAYEKLNEYKHTHNKNGKEYYCGYYRKLPIGVSVVDFHFDGDGK